MGHEGQHPKNRKSIIAQVEGSGTALMLILSKPIEMSLLDCGATLKLMGSAVAPAVKCDALFCPAGGDRRSKRVSANADIDRIRGATLIGATLGHILPTRRSEPIAHKPASRLRLQGPS